jgi:hypothetical protein
MGTIQKGVEQINFELTGTDIIAKLILNSKNIKKKEVFLSVFISETINMLLKKIN